MEKSVGEQLDTAVEGKDLTWPELYWEIAIKLQINCSFAYYSVIHPDNQFEIYIDEDLVNSGNLLKDFM